ncbi:hypothetical protein AB0M47_34560 [Hamadaea sp. NPDC051192]|uniref:hypothetical protein n=1 Tax=Hamadaea sp. NPDC051192 TaxID=3154940 RepID=UPI00341856C1
MTWFGAGMFLIGLTAFTLGLDNRCYAGPNGDVCKVDLTEINVLVLVGIHMLSASLVTWAIAAAAAGVRWRSGDERH